MAALIGITSAYFGGAYDICVQRVVDAWQSFPFLVVILAVMAVLGPGLLNLILALGILGAAAITVTTLCSALKPRSTWNGSHGFSASFSATQ